MKITDKKAEALERLKKDASLTIGMSEFVLKIDMNLDSPIVNTGCIVPVNNGKYSQLWAIVNLEEFGPFMNAQQLVAIKEALEKGTKKSLEGIKKICPTAVCVPFVPAVTMEMLKTPVTGQLIIAVHLLNAYLKNPLNRMSGQDVNYCHFASRCHIYFNNYPAGLKAGTSIVMAGNKFTPHMLNMLKKENQVFLFDFAPKRREVILVTGDNKQFNGRAENFAFPEEHQLKMSEMAATVTDFLAVYESQCKQIIDASGIKETSEKPAKKTTRKKASK